MKVKWFPRIHDEKLSWTHSVETTLTNYATMVPLIHYDEGLGTASDFESNPEHASFVTVQGANSFPESTFDNIFCSLEVSLTKGAVVTDALPAIKFGFMPIFTSFEDQSANDELSSVEIKDALELTSETTDRQAYPLYSGAANKVVEKFAGSATLSATQPGLTTTQVMEGVAFSNEVYYDMLHYMTNSGKLKACQGGMTWRTLTKRIPVMRFPIHLRSKTRNMVPYNFLGLLFQVQKAGTHYQYGAVGDSTANLPHVEVNFTLRANEWNQNFNFKKV